MAIQDNDLLLVYDTSDGVSKKITYENLKKGGSDGTGTVGYWNRTGTDLSPVNAGDSVDIGSGNITLNEDGSAEFAGNIQVAGSPTGGVAEGVLLRNNGRVEATSSQGSKYIWVGSRVGTAASTSTITADGSASFANRVSAVGLTSTDASILADRTSADDVNFLNRLNGTTTGRWQADGTMMLGGTQTGSTLNPNSTLNADGSASFVSGKVNFDSAVPVILTNGSFETVHFRNDGSLKLGGTPGPTSGNIQLNSDGSASFVGNTQVGGTPTGGAAEGVLLRKNGRVEAASNQGTTPIWEGYRVGTAAATSIIKADGSANFAGDKFTIGAGGGTIINATTSTGINTVFRINSQEGIDRVLIKADGSAHFTGSVTSDGTIGFNLEADDDTKYTTTTDSEGVETRVYNGAVLDVKERVLNLVARLDAIEANEVIDDATDSSLLTLLASASTRLDSIEARLTAGGL